MPPDSLLSGHAKTEDQHRHDICIAGRWMYERGHIVACEGNISVRLDDVRILATPTCMNKAMLEPQDLVITDLDGPVSREAFTQKSPAMGNSIGAR